MAITDLIATRNSRYATATDPSDILLIALGEIQAELQRLSINVKVSDPDFSSLEAAINNLKEGFPGPVARQDLDLNPIRQTYEDTARSIKELLGEVKTTNHRIVGLGGGSSIDPRHLTDIKRRINDAEVRMDYGARTDTNPVYIGRAESGTPTSSSWNIQFLTYDASSRVTHIQYQLGAWDSRTTLNWS